MILNTGTERPWSQYYCCMLLGNRDIVHNYPVATKRVPARGPQGLDHCAAEPLRGRAALDRRRLRDRYDYAEQTLTEVAVRLLARLRPRGHDAVLRAAPREVDMIKSTPNTILAEGTDWRILTSSSAS